MTSSTPPSSSSADLEDDTSTAGWSGLEQEADLIDLEHAGPVQAPSSLRDLAEEEPEERTLPGRRARVTLESGEELEVRIDNRDYLRWDMTAPRQKWGNSQEVLFLFVTFLSWSAAKRTGLTNLTWEAWQAAVVDVEDLTGAEDTVRPTR